MPPRKSDASAKGAAGGTTGDEGTGTPARDKDGVNVEDLNLPRTMVQRLAKGVLPPNTQIQKDAVLAMSKSATVFVSYLSSHANENAMRANKKTIMPKDVLEAVAELEFEGFLPRLEAELGRYNELQSLKRNTYRSKKADKALASNLEGDHDGRTPTAPNTTPSNNNNNSLTASLTGANGATTPSKQGKSRGNSDDDDDGSGPAAKKARRGTLNGGTGGGVSGDETISEEEGEQEEDEDEDEPDEDEEEDEEDPDGDDEAEDDDDDGNDEAAAAGRRRRRRSSDEFADALESQEAGDPPDDATEGEDGEEDEEGDEALDNGEDSD